MGTAMEAVDILIIGAGVTGLGAATRLDQLGQNDWMILEECETAGGLASTDVTKEGFLFDRGGHVIFSHYDYFDQLVDTAVGTGEESWTMHQRVSYIVTRGRRVPYPFQLNLHKLETPDIVTCLKGLSEAQILKEMNKTEKPNNFNEWINQFLGRGIGDIFMRPYNFKVWAIHPEGMQCKWIGERVATVDMNRVITNIIEKKDDVGWGPNATFRFPRYGGTGAIWKAVASRLPQERIRRGVKVTSVDFEKKVVSTSNGQLIRYNKLLSTLPLEILFVLAGNNEKAEVARGLFHNSTHVIGFGVRGTHKQGDLKWAYYPDDDVTFNRATVFSAYAEANCPSTDTMLPTLCIAGKGVTEETGGQLKPGPYWSAMLEVNESVHRPVARNKLVQDTLDSCVRSGLIDEGAEIVSIHHKRMEYGYPVPVLARDAILQELLPILREKDVWSRGRFGCHKYEVSNQDHSLMLGVEAADNMVSGTEELTLNNPPFVNSPTSGNRSRVQFSN